MEKVFAAIASTARRQILAYLNDSELTAGEIGDRFDFSKPALSNHLRVLEEAGLINREKRGQFVYFKMNNERVANTVMSWATDFCPVGSGLKKESAERARQKSASDTSSTQDDS